jgi:hypothetical protein
VGGTAISIANIVAGPLAGICNNLPKLLVRSGRLALCSLVAVEAAKSLVGAMTLQNPPNALPDECGNVRGITSKVDYRFSCTTVTELNVRTGPRILLARLLAVTRDFATVKQISLSYDAPCSY